MQIHESVFHAEIIIIMEAARAPSILHHPNPMSRLMIALWSGDKDDAAAANIDDDDDNGKQTNARHKNRNETQTNVISGTYEYHISRAQIKKKNRRENHI